MNLSDVNMFDLIQRNTENWLRKLIELIKLERYPNFLSYENYSISYCKKGKLVIKKIFLVFLLCHKVWRTKNQIWLIVKNQHKKFIFNLKDIY